ncbi:MAG: hypothetical protein BHW56_06155 [Acetobacter sp. 46_36]|nr:MAG: hypothetical protein BHW56_06155 [Acetobacter sp. 46_36]
MSGSGQNVQAAVLRQHAEHSSCGVATAGRTFLFRCCGSEQDIPVPVLRRQMSRVALKPYGNGRRGETAN